MLDQATAVMSMQRVVDGFRMDPAPAARWAKSVIEACRNISNAEFEIVCLEAQRTCKFCPSPAQMLELHRNLVAPPDRGTSRPCTQEESDSWCLREIEECYSPEMAYEMLKRIEGDKTAERVISDVVLQALMAKSAGADPEKLAKRADDRGRHVRFNKLVKSLETRKGIELDNESHAGTR